MKILDYEYSDDRWHFARVDFQDVNLVVGDSGSGKTRLLNTIFNLGSSVAKNVIIGASTWKITLGIKEDNYHWEISSTLVDDRVEVKNESLTLNGTTILERKGVEAELQGKPTSKLPKDELSLSVLREEGLISPLHGGFSRILRRRFFSDELEKNSGLFSYNPSLPRKIGEKEDLYELYKADLPLNLRLFTLQAYFQEIFNSIIGYYQECFEYITDMKLIDSDRLDLREIPISRTPVFCIQERNVKRWIPLHELSSGMQKSLLLITDLVALPMDVILFIDEYENSLGVGPINILPTILLSEANQRQVFVTSHHPYIISKFPVKNWYVAHRRGSDVSFAHGESLVKRYGLSKQDHYLQLLNDPYYSEGIE